MSYYTIGFEDGTGPTGNAPSLTVALDAARALAEHRCSEDPVLITDSEGHRWRYHPARWEEL